jgi:hypothetical protein
MLQWKSEFTVLFVQSFALPKLFDGKSLGNLHLVRRKRQTNKLHRVKCSVVDLALEGRPRDLKSFPF